MDTSDAVSTVFGDVGNRHTEISRIYPPPGWRYLETDKDNIFKGQTFIQKLNLISHLYSLPKLLKYKLKLHLSYHFLTYFKVL